MICKECGKKLTNEKDCLGHDCEVIQKTGRKKISKDVVHEFFLSRMEDIRILFKADEQETKELGSLNDYGLSIDKVEAGTFRGQREDYIRYQLSWGGPSEEFRIYKNGEVEFWFLDWFDGACVLVTGEDAEIIKEIVSYVEW